jgi:hypothetical protein
MYCGSLLPGERNTFTVQVKGTPPQSVIFGSYSSRVHDFLHRSPRRTTIPTAFHVLPFAHLFA